MQKNSEGYIQIYLVSFLRKCGVLTAHVPNGGFRSKQEAAKLKLMGVLPGLPDLMLVANKKIAFIELKVSKGTVSPSQVQVMGILEDNDIKAYTIYAIDPADAIAQAGIILLEYFGIDYQTISASSTKVLDGLE